MIPRLAPALGWGELFSALTPPARDERERYESEFARELGHAHALAFPYGRTGLALLLEALGLSGREIILPAYTCVVVPHAIVTSGNEPVFIDSREDDYNMDLDLAEAAINERTGALVATSIHGHPVDLERLDELRRAHPEVAIIQDCAHSFGAEWNRRPVQREGAAALYGLNISKLIGSIFGGMVGTDDDALRQRLARLRDERVRAPGWRKAWQRRLYLAAVYPAFQPLIYGLVNRLERSHLLDRFVKYYDECKIDMPADYLVGMTRVEARVGRVQVSRYAEVVRRRREVAAFYDEALSGTPGLCLPPRAPGATHLHYVPRTERKREIVEYALRHGVQLGELIEYSCADMPAYRGRPGNRYPCPIARKLSETTINLPVWGELSAKHRKVARVVKSYHKTNQRR